MTTIRKVSYQNICLFDDKSIEAKNALKDFIYYLKASGRTGILNFSYSGGVNSLHPHLSIKDNLILDAIPKSFIKSNVDNFFGIINELQNKSLKLLLESLEDLDYKVKDLSLDDINLVSLIKTLLSGQEDLFLLNPGLNLSKNNIDIIKDAIEFEVYSNHKNVFIKSQNKELWFDITTHFISINEDKTFSKVSNPLKGLNKISSSFSPTYDFTLIKRSS